MTDIEESDTSMRLAAERESSRCTRSSLKRRARIVCQVFAVAYILVLTVFLVHPDAFALFGSDGKAVEGEVDASVPGLLQHLGAYVLLGILLYAGFEGPRFPAVGILTVMALHGLATEAIQAIVPNRTSDWGDLAADLSGAVLAVVVCSWFGSRLCHPLPYAALCIWLTGLSMILGYARVITPIAATIL